MATLELNVNPQGVVAGTNQAKAALAGVKGEAVKAEAALSRVGTNGTTATKRLGTAVGSLGRAMSGARGQIQNAAFQVGDFAVQVGAGQRASTALAQQLPQLLGGFGVLGAVMGAVVAIGVPLVAAFLNSGEAAMEMEARLDDLSDSVTAYLGASQQARKSNAELSESFGSAAESMRPLLTLVTDVSAQTAADKLNATMRALSETFGGINTAGMDSVNVSIRDFGVGASEAAKTTDKLADSFGITTEESAKLVASLQGLEGAQGLEAQIAAGNQLANVLLDVFGTSENIPKAFRPFIGALDDAVQEAARLKAELEDAEGAASRLSVLDLVSNIRAATDEAVLLAEKFGMSLDLARKIAGIGVVPGNNNTVQGFEANDTRNPNSSAPIFTNARTFGSGRPARTSGVGGGGGGGRGGGGRSGGLDQEARAVERLRDSYRDLLGSMDDVVAAQHEYEDSQKLLNEALAKGVISQKEFDAAMVQVTDRMEEAKLSATDARDNFSSFFTSILTGAKSAKEALADLFAEIASRRLTAAFDGLFASLGGGGGGGILNFLFNAKGNAISGGNVVPFASGGVVNSPTFFPMKGQTGVMGEAGPEAIMPLKRGSDGKLGVASGGGGGGQQTKIINVLDPAIVGDYLNTRAGEDMIVNLMSRNRESLVA